MIQRPALEPEPAPGEATAPSDVSDFDPQSQRWLERLRADGPERSRAEADLHRLLLKACRFEIGRRQGALANVRGEDLDDIAHQAAADALMAVLSKLEQFRGASRFTTWVYKFAILEAGVRLRRRAWQDREVTLDAEHWPAFADRGASPHQRAGQTELLDAMRDSVHSCLTPHQRNVLLALALNGVPIDVLSERLSTTRGALYKTLHDARRKLRADLESKGFEVDAI